MKFEEMDTPVTREAFEHRFHLLIEQIRQEKFHSAIDTGLSEVRYLPNGRIDMLSINESARLSANMIVNFPKEKLDMLIDEQNIKDSSNS